MGSVILSNAFHSLWKGALAALIGGAATLLPMVASGNYKGAIGTGVSLLVWGSLAGIGITPPKGSA